MNSKTQILNWLSRAFFEPPTSLKEYFYFDPDNSVFFSWRTIDLLIVSDIEKGTLKKGVKVSYSQNEIQKFQFYVSRIEDENVNIIFVPYLSREERQSLVNKFLQEIASKEPSIDKQEKIKEKLIWEFSKDDRLEFHSSAENELIWNQMKTDMLEKKINLFLDQYSIDLSKCSILNFFDKPINSPIPDVVSFFDRPNTFHENNISKKDKSKWWQIWK